MIRNPIAWCVWAFAAVAAAFIDRNPFLQALLLMVLINVGLAYRAWRPGSYWKVGLVLASVPILFSVALSRFGRHLLFTLPGIPVIGGRWTWDAVAFGTSTGLALLLTVGVFAVLQATVKSADLVPLVPKPLYRAGTAFALALAFAPQTVRSFRSIQEARRLRGARAGLRSTPALLVPLLLTTLERALQYGESLDARGYGSHRRSRYRPLLWTTPDIAVVVASLGSLIVAILTAPAPYNAYVDLLPRLPSPVDLAAVLLLVVPAATAAIRPMDRAADRA
jgi:energy-coupling factor transport system permease protein